MSIKVVKSVRDVGQADAEGVSFPESDLLRRAREAFLAARQEAHDIGIVTGPAQVKIIVEQEVVTND